MHLKKTYSSINHKLKYRIGILFIFLLFVFSVKLSAQSGKAIFEKNCSSCHTVGKGRLVGPDLSGVTGKYSEEWLLKWTKSSQSLVNSGDTDAKKIFEEFKGLVMPDQKLNDNEIKSIFAFISDSNSGTQSSGGSGSAEIATNAAQSATPEQIENGKNLFEGKVEFINRGPSCISCHEVNYKGVLPGGLLAKNLTTAYSRMGGDMGLQGILGAPPFPAMTDSFSNHPLTEGEINDLIAFLYKVDSDQQNQVSASVSPLLKGGIPGVILLFVLYFIIWHNRKRRSVKESIYNRQIKSI